MREGTPLMNKLISPNGRPRNCQGNSMGKRSFPRWLAGIGASLGLIFLVLLVLIFVFGHAILNGYGKDRLQHAFAAAHPGSVLQIGELAYSIGGNRLVADSVTLSSPGSTCKVGWISLTGVHWGKLIWGTAEQPEILAMASLEATNLDVKFPQAQYGIRFARLRASVPDSELIGEGAELISLLPDEALFAATKFRTTRYHLVVPIVKVSGLAYGDLLQGTAYRASSIGFTRPAFDALVNRDKPSPPFTKSPLMVHEALAAILRPLRIDHLGITNGRVSYRERMAVGASPGVLTFSAINLSVEGIANQGGPTAAIQLRGQGDFMNAGIIKVQMSIPISPPDFSFQYSGSLSAMDLTRLDAFLDVAERTRIKSGRAREVTFEIDVTGGAALGRVRAIYQDLKIAVLDDQTGAESGFKNRVASFLANTLSIHSANAPDASGAMYEGKVIYTRKPEDKFVPFVWQALRTGILDVINH